MQMMMMPKNIPTETTSRGGQGVAVFVQDQTTGVLDLPFLRAINESITLAADTVVDTYAITLTAGHGLSEGLVNAAEILEIADPANGSWFYQGEIISVAGDVVTLGTPINRVFPASTSFVLHSSEDMNVNGSLTLGENIGDLGGLTIAFKAYELSLNGQKSPEIDGFTGEQRFFMGCYFSIVP